MGPPPNGATAFAVPRIEALRVANYRALRDFECRPTTPLTVLVGPNGSGKSTVVDVFAFLAEAFEAGLRSAWQRRGRFKELRTRGQSGPIVFELSYRDAPGRPLTTYHLTVGETADGPVAEREWLACEASEGGGAARVLDFARGAGRVVPDDAAGRAGEPVREELQSPDVLAASVLGQFARHPRLAALRRFVLGWRLTRLSADEARAQPAGDPQPHLSPTGDNLASVVQYLRQEHPGRLERIVDTLRRSVPRLEQVAVDVTPDGRLRLLVKDQPFERPIPARYVSDGTLALLAYLTLLRDPAPPPFVIVEEPEAQLHPRLLPELAEECREAAGHSQLMITTHSPLFLDALRPNEAWVLYRDDRGHTRGRCTAQMQGVPEFMEHGAKLGDLWLEGYFEVGDPLTAQGSTATLGPGPR